MACEIATRQKNFKSVIAKKLIMFNALSYSRPRTELGQPVLYEKIKENKEISSDGEKLRSRRSFRALSDPDIKASLIKADEQFFKNEPLCDEQEALQSSNDDCCTTPENRKSVKELMLAFEHKPKVRIKQSRTNTDCGYKTPRHITGGSGEEVPHSAASSLTRSHGGVEPYEVVTLSLPSGIDGSSELPDCYVEPGSTLSRDAELYVNCQILTPGNITQNKVVQNGDLHFVEDHFGKQEESPGMSKDSTSHLSPTYTASVSSGYQSMTGTEELGSLRDSTFGTSMSDVSDYSDDDEGWDTDEFDDDSSDEDTKQGEGTVSEQVELSGPQKKVYNIVMEILTTERAYVKRLDLLEEVYCERLLKEARENGTIPEKVVTGIFPNLSSIRTFHKTVLLPDLEERMKTWSQNQRIGDIFKYVGHFLKMYTFYVKNFDEANKTLNQWMKKSPKIASIVDELQKLPESEHLTLQNHMLEPIQRVPRYKLLLQDYLKKLPEDSPDRAEAEASLAIISEAATHANESMKIMDVFKKLMEIQERIAEGLHGDTLITASRRFVKEGELTKIAARSDKKTLRVLLLFNDVVMCCSKLPGTKLKVKQVMDVDGMVVRDGAELDYGDKCSFRIKSRQRVLDLACLTEEAKDEWIEAITQAVSDLYEKRASVIKRKSEGEIHSKTGSIQVGVEAPSWIRDDDTIMCMLCASRFWFINRRHHCRGCGRIVCESCSKYKASLEYAGNSTKRVCYACFKKLRQVEDTDLVENRERELNNDKLKRSSVILSDMSSDLQWKQPGKGWSRGYFALSEFVLYVYKKKQDVLASLTIPLPGYCVEEYTQQSEQGNSNPKNAFSLHKANIKEMTYFFQADSEKLMNRWLDVLKYAVKAELPPADPT